MEKSRDLTQSSAVAEPRAMRPHPRLEVGDERNMMQIDHTQPEIDTGTLRADELDSDARALLDALQDAGAPDLTQLSPEQTRTLLGDLFTPDVEPEPVASVNQRKISAYARDIRVRIYDPNPDQMLPGVVYFHGGGWVVGNLDTVVSR
ncbi:hypothetical protein [Haladaptatus cibarius]|uniref:hypothetical protein n=1 Tax=Haladaptatus cibarius TaxID=453847 RepID=UPI0006791ABF|nr:hypothetical protein [Haladaptatus cibarius]